MASRSLGTVSKCSLAGAEKFNVYSGKYCVVSKGERTQSEAYSLCKALNSKLPLPKNEVEMASFLKLSPKKTWIGITDPVRD